MQDTFMLGFLPRKNLRLHLSLHYTITLNMSQDTNIDKIDGSRYRSGKAGSAGRSELTWRSSFYLYIFKKYCFVVARCHGNTVWAVYNQA